MRVAAVDGRGNIDWSDSNPKVDCIDPVQGNFFAPMCAASAPGAPRPVAGALTLAVAAVALGTRGFGGALDDEPPARPAARSSAAAGQGAENIGSDLQHRGRAPACASTRSVPAPIRGIEGRRPSRRSCVRDTYAARTVHGGRPSICFAAARCTVAARGFRSLGRAKCAARTEHTTSQPMEAVRRGRLVSLLLARSARRATHGCRENGTDADRDARGRFNAFQLKHAIASNRRHPLPEGRRDATGTAGA